MADWSGAPAVLVFADTPEGGAAAKSAVASHRGRILAMMHLDQAVDRLQRQVSVDLVIVDVAKDHGPLLDGLFRAIEDGVAAQRFSAVVVVVPQLVDAATARIGHGSATVLVGRDPTSLRDAIGENLARAEPELRDPPDDGAHRPLHFLIDEAARLGRTLGDSEYGCGGTAFDDMDDDLAAPRIESLRASDAATIREMIRARRLRDELFGQGLFADPAWDILLDLTAARIEGRAVAVSSLCIAAAVPATTALRWIKQLTEEGLLQRVADPDDGRRVFIELTSRAASIMMTFFASAARASRT